MSWSRRPLTLLVCGQVSHLLFPSVSSSMRQGDPSLTQPTFTMRLLSGEGVLLDQGHSSNKGTKESHIGQMNSGAHRGLGCQSQFCLCKGLDRFPSLRSSQCMQESALWEAVHSAARASMAATQPLWGHRGGGPRVCPTEVAPELNFKG